MCGIFLRKIILLKILQPDEFTDKIKAENRHSADFNTL